MKKLQCLLLVTTLLFSLMLTGCGGTDSGKDAGESENNSVSNKETTKGTEATPAEKITLRLATWDDATAAKNTQKIIDEFKKENPNVEVQFEPQNQDYLTKLRTSIAGGNTPDVMMVDQWPSFYSIDPNPFEPLDEYFTKLNIPKTIFADDVLKLWNYQGKQYALPADVNNVAFFYNKKLFDQAGLPYPQDGWTWEDVKNNAIKLTKGEGAKKVYGIQLAADWIGAVESMIWGAGGRLIDDNNQYEGAMNSPESIAAIDWYASFARDGYAPQPLTSKAMGGDVEMFKTGKIAMILQGHWNIQGFKQTEGFDINNVGGVSLPVGPAGVKPAIIFSAGFHMSKDCEHKDEAFKLLYRMTDAKAQKAKCESGWSLPAVPSVIDELNLASDPLRKPFIDMMYSDGFTRNKFSIYHSPMATEIEEQLKKVMEKVIFKKADAKTALDEAVKEIKTAETKK